MRWLFSFCFYFTDFQLETVSKAFHITEYYHTNNAFTMNDYLENHLPENCEIILEDGSYAEIDINSIKSEVHAGGDGDSFNHRIKFITIE